MDIFCHFDVGRYIQNSRPSRPRINFSELPLIFWQKYVTIIARIIIITANNSK